MEEMKDKNNETKEIKDSIIYYIYSPKTFRLICNVDWEISLDHKTTVEPPIYNAAYEIPFWNREKNKWDVKVIDEDQKILTQIMDGKYNI